MAYTLSDLTSKLRLKINQVSTNSNLVWEDSELYGYINAAIKHVINFGSLKLIQASAYKRTTDAAGDHLTNNGSGYATKPSDYLRYINGKVDAKYIRRIIDASEIEFIQGNSLTAADSNRKYVCDISGTEFLVFPTDFSSFELVYIAEPSDLASSTDTSPLTNTGDNYALDWAYALALESKLFKPEVAQVIFKRVQELIMQ
jgi:hypothetical protein